MCMGTLHAVLLFTESTSIFDIMFAFWYDKALSYWGLLLRKRICSYGGKPFPLKSHISKMEAIKIHTTASP